MVLLQLAQHFMQGLMATTPLEAVAVASGIGSVWFSKRENILVYPVGLLSTIIYTWLSFKYHLIGEASVNFYYTVVSIWGWWLWARKDARQQTALQITGATARQRLLYVSYTAILYILLFFILTYLKSAFYPGVIPWGDAFASATAFVGMWLMAKKKVESWWWWIATNVASIPLYFVKGLVFTSAFYAVLLVMAVFGLHEWQVRARAATKFAT